MKTIFISVIILITLFSLNVIYAQPADTPWQMFGHDSKHTFRSPYVGPELAKINWSYKAVGSIYSSPAIAEDGTIYFGSEKASTSEGVIYAMNPDGTMKWSYETVSEIHSSPAIGESGTIYIGSDNGEFYARKANNSTYFKKLAGGSISSSPVVDSAGNVYFGSDDNKLWCLQYDGTFNWTFTAGDDIYSSPAIDNSGNIYFGCFDAKIYSLTPGGSLRWDFTTTSPILSSPAIGTDGTIYIGLSEIDNCLLALNPDGTERWRYATTSFIYGAPAIGSDGTIYVGCVDGYLYAVSPDGTLAWSHHVGSAMRSSPAIGADGTIHIGTTNGYLYAVDRDGDYKWKIAFDDEIFASPAIGADGTIYVCSKDRHIYALENAAAPTPTPTLTATPTLTPTPPEDTTPPTVSILSPADDATVSGNVDVRIKADDESGIDTVEVQFSGGTWNKCKIGSDDSYWHFNWDTAAYSGMSVLITARATDASANANLGYSVKINVTVESIPPEVDIMSEFTTFTAGDTIEIGVSVDNPSGTALDMYAAILLGNNLFWYPMWTEVPYPTVIEETTWVQLIASFTCVPEIPAGNYTFYAAITEHMTYDLLGIDSVTITIH